MRLKIKCVLAELNGEYVAVPLKGEESFHGVIRLNDTGATIIRGLQDGMTEQQIAEKLTKEYEGVDYEHALESVSKAMQLLQDNNLLEVDE